MRYKRVGAMVLLLVGAACSGRAPSDNAEAGPRSWPMFGGNASRNLANTVETGIVDNWSIKKGKEKNIKWSAKLGTRSVSSPVIADGRVFIGTNRFQDEKKGVLMCFRESDGKLLWQAVHEPLEDSSGAQDYGVASSPCVDGERVYYVNNRWEVVCAAAAGDPAAGKAKILWTLDMVKELKVYPGGLAGSLSICSPLVIEDLVFVVTANGVNNEGKTPAPEAPSFIAIDKNSGKVVWQDHSPGAKIMDGEWSNPTAAKINGRWQVIFPGGDGWLYGFEAKTGKLIWKFNCNSQGADFKPGGRGTAGYPVGTPVVWDNKVYIAIGREPEEANGGVGHLWCIDITKEPKNKDKDLSPINNNFDPKDPVNKDSGLVWHYGGPILPKPADAEREYHFTRSLGTVAIHDGLLYAAEMMGFLHCLDAKTGKKFLDYDLKANTWSSPFYADGKVFMGTDDGTMYVFRHGKELKKPTKIDMGAALPAPPAAANGVLFISNGERLFAIAK